MAEERDALATLRRALDGFARYDEDRGEWEEDPAEQAIETLRMLPVEKRMEAMGMERFCPHDGDCLDWDLGCEMYVKAEATDA